MMRDKSDHHWVKNLQKQACLDCHVQTACTGHPAHRLTRPEDANEGNQRGKLLDSFYSCENSEYNFASTSPYTLHSW
jgi:hypothetical protein